MIKTINTISRQVLIIDMNKLVDFIENLRGKPYLISILLTGVDVNSNVKYTFIWKDCKFEYFL